MLGFIQRIQDVVRGPRNGSKNDAKQRLKVLLIHDQVNITPAQMDLMREEIMAIVAKYVEIDDENISFSLNREEDHVALVSNFPVRRVTGARA